MSDSPRLPARPSLEQLRKQAKELLRQFRAGDAAAIERLHAGDAATLADAQLVVAREYGFETWAALKHHVEALHAAPAYTIDRHDDVLLVTGPTTAAGWDAIAAVLAEHRIGGLRAAAITDAALQRLSRLEHITFLDFDGAIELTDDGLASLAAFPRLTDLNLSGVKGRITDRGLEVLRRLPALRRIRLCWQPNISDAGIAALASCDRLAEVDLMGTFTGDGAIHALAGKPALRHFKSGRNVSDAGLAELRRFPVFRTWQGGEPCYNLLSVTAEPNHLVIDGPFTNAGVAALAGLEGLFGLSFFWHCSALTGAGLEPLKDLPHLAFLGCGGSLCDDESMRAIARLPRLRMLMAQGTVASDDGFVALSRSSTLEYFWGRECPNLTGCGFAALAGMAALRGLAVGCRNVDDAALSTLPRFPALRALLPMEVGDEGFRHVGRCQKLEELWCMYCRETGDAATAHIAGLPLKTYYAGQTKITDRSLEILGRMATLECVELQSCRGITNAGIAHLARLPRLREIGLGALAGVTPEAAGLFRNGVRVKYSA